MTTKTIKYIEIRIDQLNEELAKNPSEENTMIIGKAVSELTIVLDMLKRQQQLSVEPYKGIDDPYYSGLP